MTRYYSNVEASRTRYFLTAWIRPAPSTSRSEKATNKQRNVNSKKRRESQHRSSILESSHILSHPRTKLWRYSPAKVMIPSGLITWNHLKHHSTQETKASDRNPKRQHLGLQGDGKY